ncbi:hypothetical protein CTA2_12596 [Colletotrichum tanaceti]|uniref:Uncharacterized protein n=1 Tax=Colletotrichum tanaceti TaxID=1306861 RepID=A0A4U6XTA2_9PEZI|nr:hypothetical protein CTA2_12596 [Colletotrichum tanaceti]TKW59122.1 hypothetical protein CTA1_848 [Colletotrichum tanaceti]
MKFLLAVIVGAGAALAGVVPRAGPAPPAAVGAPLEGSVQAITHLYICSNINFGGDCLNVEVSTGNCYNLNGWNDIVSSLGPDQGTSCTIYEHNGCSGAFVSNIVHPGISNLGDRGFNDRGKSDMT